MKVTYKIIEWKNRCFFNELASFDNELDASLFFDSLLKCDWFKRYGFKEWDIELQKTTISDNFMMKIEIMKEQTLYEEVFFEDLKSSYAVAWNAQKQNLEYVN